MAEQPAGGGGGAPGSPAVPELDRCTRCRGTGTEPGLIPIPGLEPARLRSIRRDGLIVWKFRCPECHQWGGIDDDQLHGRVSIDHTDQGCPFHRTLDLYTMTMTERP